MYPSHTIRKNMFETDHDLRKTISVKPRFMKRRFDKNPVLKTILQNLDLVKPGSVKSGFGKTQSQNAWRNGYASSPKLNLFCMDKTGLAKP